MKAINCTQCGATINDVSETSVIIDCEYCGARILLDQPAPVKPKPIEFTEPLILEPESQDPSRVITLIGGVVMAIVVFGVMMMIAVKPKESTPTKVYSAPQPVVPAGNTAWIAPATSKPLPVVNYQPRVSWSGPSDMEYFDEPEVDVSSVSDLTSEEVKKTVFKNRTVKLRVVINTEGEIDTVETISGHPVLVAAATESAKGSIFSSRSKPTTRILTYTFRVLPD